MGSKFVSDDERLFYVFGAMEIYNERMKQDYFKLEANYWSGI